MIKLMKSPLGYALTGIALILSLSPEARKAARKLAVKGTELILETSDQIKSIASGIKPDIPVSAEAQKKRLTMENVSNATNDDFRNKLDTLQSEIPQ